MARYPQGWRIRLPPNRSVYTVYFTHNGRRVDRSTGCSDPEQAAKEAARIYADFVQREPPKRRIVRRGDSPALPELVELWLTSDTTIDPSTVDTWTVYGGHWSERWETLVGISESTAEQYRNDRLRTVMATTVRKELSALRRFLRWCRMHGYLQREVVVPGVPSSATGKRFGARRRSSAPELTPQQATSIIAALPEWSTSRKVAVFPIRARFVVAYETGLRPGTLDAISVPEHYQHGSDRLALTDDVDKVRWGREVPLSELARKALDAVCPEEGPIFGRHDYREHLDAAARSVLPKALADRFCGAHFRSASITHLLERTGNLAAAQYLAGHRQPKTTAEYVRPSYRAAAEAIRVTRDSIVYRRKRRA
ncbi:MAG: site-specific integrase [Anaerolineae bacterium]|nr:MAG: site-specific integrase [Anaerolineae bacterium]